MVSTKRHARCALAALIPALVLLFVPAAAAADDAVAAAGAASTRGILSHWDGERLVVVDTNEGVVRAFEVSDSGIRIVGSTDLHESAPPKARPAETFPSRDVPGEDPPGFIRPAGAVRIASSMQQDRGSRRWEATYLVSGEFEDVYTRIVESLQGWTIREARAMRFPERSRFGAGLEASQGDDVLEIDLGGKAEQPRLLRLSVRLRRELD